MLKNKFSIFSLTSKSAFCPSAKDKVLSMLKAKEDPEGTQASSPLLSVTILNPCSHSVHFLLMSLENLQAPCNLLLFSKLKSNKAVKSLAFWTSMQKFLTDKIALSLSELFSPNSTIAEGVNLS